MSLNHFTVQFSYPPPYGSGPTGTEDHAANARHMDFDDALVKHMEGFEWAMEHSWPDGSLWYCIRTALDAKQLQAELVRLLDGSDLSVELIMACDIDKIRPNGRSIADSFRSKYGIASDLR